MRTASLALWPGPSQENGPGEPPRHGFHERGGDRIAAVQPGANSFPHAAQYPAVLGE
jgi:hypothetical protein